MFNLFLFHELHIFSFNKSKQNFFFFNKALFLDYSDFHLLLTLIGHTSVELHNDHTG